MLWIPSWVKNRRLIQFCKWKYHEYFFRRIEFSLWKKQLAENVGLEFPFCNKWFEIGVQRKTSPCQKLNQLILKNETLVRPPPGSSCISILPSLNMSGLYERRGYRNPGYQWETKGIVPRKNEEEKNDEEGKTQQAPQAKIQLRDSAPLFLISLLTFYKISHHYVLWLVQVRIGW